MPEYTQDTQETILQELFDRKESVIQSMQRQYTTYLSSIARNILHNPEDVEESINDTWLRAWNTIPPKRPDNLKIYLGCLTRNISISRYRANHAEKRGGDNVRMALEELSDSVAFAKDNVGEAVNAAALQDAVNAFLGTLSEEQRNLFIYRYFFLDSEEEIAHREGISRAKVKVALYRLRLKLKERLIQEDLFQE
jgi:RNA polymerase sigma factor (sigma-70 family)